MTELRVVFDCLWVKELGKMKKYVSYIYRNTVTQVNAMTISKIVKIAFIKCIEFSLQKFIILWSTSNLVKYYIDNINDYTIQME